MKDLKEYMRFAAVYGCSFLYKEPEINGEFVKVKDSPILEHYSSIVVLDEFIMAISKGLYQTGLYKEYLKCWNIKVTDEEHEYEYGNLKTISYYVMVGQSMGLRAGNMDGYISDILQIKK